MPRNAAATRQRILDEAMVIVATESLSNLCLERISKQAGVTKKTFYAHFSSKDHFLAALVEHQRPHYLDRYRMWADACGQDAPLRDRIVSIFNGISNAAKNPQWKGSCFIRLTAELGNLKGHPVHAIVARANRDMEEWFEAEFLREGYGDAEAKARQLTVLINGLLMMQLVSPDTAYGSAVMALVDDIVPVWRAAA